MMRLTMQMTMMLRNAAHIQLQIVSQWMYGINHLSVRYIALLPNARQICI